MALNHSPSIVTNGIVQYLDAGNIKSYKVNLTNYSTYNSTYWSNLFPANTTITTGISDPFGGSNAVRITCVASGSSLLRVTFDSFTPSGTQPYVVSFYVRKVSGTTSTSGQLTCDLADATPSGDYAPYLVTGQWVRVQFTATPSATLRSFFDILSDNTTDYVLDYYGLQIETGTVASPYVATNGVPLQINTMYDIADGRNASLLYPSYATLNDGALLFNGTSDYASCGNLGTLYTQGTISAWFNSSSVANYRTVLCTQFDGLNSGMRIEQQNSGQITAYAGNGTNVTGPLSFGTISAGSWYKVDLTWNTSANTVTGYLNGVQGFSSSNTYWPSTIPSLTMGIGYSSTISYRWYQGYIAQLMVYNVSLLPDQVLANYNALRTRFGL